MGHRKIFVMGSIVLLFVLVLSACSTSKTNEVDNLKPDDTASTVLDLEVEPSQIDIDELPYSIKLTIINPSEDEEYRGGYHYTIEYLDGDKWVQVLNPIVYDDELVIEPTGEFEFEVAVDPIDYDYSIGTYRVNFTDDGYAEFSIVD